MSDTNAPEPKLPKEEAQKMLDTVQMMFNMAIEHMNSDINEEGLSSVGQVHPMFQFLMTQFIAGIFAFDRWAAEYEKMQLRINGNEDIIHQDLGGFQPDAP